MNNYYFEIDADNSKIRIDKFLADNIEELTRSSIASLIENNGVTVNGNTVAKNYKLRINDKIYIEIPEPVEYDAVAEDIPLDIVYEDNDLIVVNKPKGMVVHPAAGNYSGTLVNALLFHCKDNLSGINGVLRPGIVHRIDKNTSGLLIVAKNDNAHKKLAEQIKEHSFTREYEAIVIGNLKDDRGVIDAPIGRHHINRKKMAITDRNSKNAVTHYEVIARYKGYTHVKCILETGRTHQIRVHMAYIGHPVSGDDVYGNKKEQVNFSGQCLHARKIGFIHPTSGEYLEFTSELPDYFKEYLKKLKNLSK